MKTITLILALLVSQISNLHAVSRFDSIPLEDGSPSGFRLILPGTPAAIEAQQKTFLPPAEIRTNNAIFTLKAVTDEASFDARNLPQRPIVLQPVAAVRQNTFSVVPVPSSARTNPSFNVRNPIQIPSLSHQQTFSHVSEPSIVPVAPEFIVRNPTHHSFPQVPELTVVRPLVPTRPQNEEFKFSQVPASTFETDTFNKFVATPEDANIAHVPAPHTFTVTRTPASNQATHTTFKHTSTFDATKTESFVSTTQTPKMRVRPTISPALHKFNTQSNVEVKKSEFIDTSKFNGESLLDIRSQLPEEVVVAPVTSAPVLEITTRPARVRVAVTKRVRGPMRKVVSKMSIITDRKPSAVDRRPEVVLPTTETLQRNPEVVHVPVTRHQASSFVNTASVNRKPTSDIDNEEFERQAHEAEYSFTSAVNDSFSDSAIMHHESRKDGAVEGSYSYSDGFFRRTVHYKADHLGYRVLSEEVEPLGDGPRPDPEGHAQVALDTSSGVHSQYFITSDDIQDPDYEA